MQIVIPDEAEGLLKEQAVIAGYEEVSDYVVSLVLQDHASRKQLDVFAEDERLEQLAVEAEQSGPAVPLDMDGIRRDVQVRLQRRP